MNLPQESSKIHPSLLALARRIGQEVATELFEKLRDVEHVLPPEYLDTKQVSQLSGVPVKTLEGYRHARTGPTFIRVGHGRGRVRYKYADVIEWLESRRVSDE